MIVTEILESQAEIALVDIAGLIDCANSRVVALFVYRSQGIDV